MTLNGKKFHKYLSVTEEDHKWGLYITGAGSLSVGKDTEYPPRDHPSHHYFEWSEGRKLTAYQILYITSGKGIFESELTGVKALNAGDIVFLFPGVWHRYRPDKGTGWNEYWVEFNGEILNHYRRKGFLDEANPILPVGLNEEMVEDYLKITRIIQCEKPGFQYVSSGIIIHMLGEIFAAQKINSAAGPFEKRINEAKLMILENLNTKISQEHIARNIGMGYSLYRKKFRELTGISPASYQLQMRINIAKHLLLSSNKSLKEISQNMGFESPDYFCRFFKQKTGITPSEYRCREGNKGDVSE
ncbi:MAG TPA: AraC family transcriptional regulator [Bacteroidales bacterium]|nr:AraC family transcriptional regulator [Bacteroidales bacterium]